jgi:hypothetical protein
MLDSATREALEARLRFYRELGLTEFYRRPVDLAIISTQTLISEQESPSSVAQTLGAQGLASETWDR